MVIKTLMMIITSHDLGSYDAVLLNLYLCAPLCPGIKLHDTEPQGFADAPGIVHVGRSGRGSALLMTAGGQHCCYHDGHGMACTSCLGQAQKGNCSTMKTILNMVYFSLLSLLTSWTTFQTKVCPEIGMHPRMYVTGVHICVCMYVYVRTCIMQ